MMKKVTILMASLMFVFVMAGCGAGGGTSHNLQEGEPAEQTAGTESPAPTPGDSAGSGEGSGGFLWKVSHNGNTVHMLGSIHVATADFYPLNSKIESAFDESDALVVEADVANIDPAAMQQQIDGLAKYADGSKLKDHLTPELYSQLKHRLDEYGIPEEMVENYEIWYVNMLLESMDAIATGLDPQQGIDYYFLQKAKDSKDILELEGAQFQFEMFDGFSEDVQKTLLELALNPEADKQETLQQLAEYWKTGNEQGLAELLFAPVEEKYSDNYAIYMEALTDKRNVTMTEKIEQYLQGEGNKTYFVVVGTAHYLGDQGIVKLLERKGYKVEKEL
ncbi:hypothetical protein PAE9249_00419 [Paenibacillus sp. CECT 9249]|uniref:TraB/GumN family protein n=1 Tax=Paenibacillus sp. CECT 9249 TaxID=2845385 RepID=UPI001E34B6C3|nr:TraB/GumN family protein [Paenibacillus sp. CECT 9249]CAH0117954.1 hypothetical protein PAE9249_00419 [Paenibacillus sp. CECT 9249]